MDDSVITCHEVVDKNAKSNDEETKSVPKNFNEKKQPGKQKFSVLFAFLLITIVLLIAASIYCSLIKYWAKQKHLIPMLKMSNKIKVISIKNSQATFSMISSI